MMKRENAIEMAIRRTHGISGLKKYMMGSPGQIIWIEIIKIEFRKIMASECQ